VYYVTKTYGHELGLSACFRQWRAKSHCRFLHGYPLSFKLTFGASTLDENNWVLDFGGLKEVKGWLVATFDHRLLVAADDPHLERIKALNPTTNTMPDGTPVYLIGDERQLADVLVIPSVGCEGFAEFVFQHVLRWLDARGHTPRVFLQSVEVREHAGNSAIVTRATVGGIV
jgi:6-pyruvoyltetrahydropterin/6-carboxytetrahydropterin synthase